MNENRFSPTRLRRARGTRSLAEIAVAADVSEQTIRNWEAGKYEPDATALARIATATGRHIGYFFERVA